MAPPSTKRKKQSTEGWPVAFSSLLKKPKTKKSQDSLDFLGSSSEDSQESALELPSLAATGTVLEACNGSDIQLARGASARPNLAKGRGRYLIVLPGMLSLKTQKKPAPAAAAESEVGASPATQESEASSCEKQIESENNGGDTKKVESSNNKTPAKRKPFTPRVTTLGKIEKMDSDHPVMKVPFGDGRTLVFEGKKVNTSSKFMNIHCKANKGSVTCKDIFTSAIVFGEAKVEGGGVPTKNENDEEAPFRHYGGSDRTVDGVVTGAAKKKLLKQRAAARPKAHSANTQVTPSSDIEILDDNDDDDESDVEVNLGATPPPRAPRPKRRAASQKKIELLDDSDEEEEESEEESVASQGTPPPRAPRPQRRASSQRKVLNLDESEESDFEMDDEARPPPRASTSKRKAAASKKKPPPSDSEESDVDTDTATPPRKPPSKRKATATQNKAPVAKKARKAKKETSDDDLSFASSASEEVVVVGTKDKNDEEEWAPGGGDGATSIDLSTPTKRPRTSHARRSAKKAAKEIDLTEDQSEKESSDSGDERAAPKSRKSRSSRSTNKTAREVDLTVDDGDDSEEDEEDDESESEEESDYSE